MLSVFRRHITKCKHYNGDKRDERRTQNDCQCPVYYDWQTPERKRTRAKLHTSDWATAQKIAREMELSGKTPVESHSKTLADALDNFEATLKAKGNADTTLHQYRTFNRALTKFATNKGFTLLSQLDVEQINEFRNGWDCADRTTVKRLERLKKFFKFCVRMKWITENPAEGLENPELEDSDVTPFSETEVAAILKAATQYPGPSRQRLTVLIDLMLASGLRISDAVTFRKDCIKRTENGYAFDLRTCKTDERVYCPLSDELAERLISLEGETPFWSGQGTVDHAAQSWRERLKTVFETAGIPEDMRKPHRFRHTLAKRALQHPKHPLTMVQLANVLGHKSALITDRYYNKFIAERDIAIDSSVRKLWSQGGTDVTSAAK
jgi:integrase/recombinase XerD